MWATEPPHAIHEVPLYSEKTGMWRAISRCRIVGPVFFFHDTLNTARYLQIFNEFVNQIDDYEVQNGYFQQDGATYHTSHESMTEIRSFFGDRIISKDLWPPRSPDLTPPDFFLWGALKGKEYVNKPRTIQKLETNIRREVAAIIEDVLQVTFANMQRRVRLCRDSGGGHFQHLQ
jgi:hypothetical protein